MVHTIKFLLLTIIYLTALVAAFLYGWFDVLWLTDTYHIAKGIFGVFLFYSAMAFVRVLQLDKELLFIDIPSNRLFNYIDKIKNNANKEIHIHNLELFIQSNMISIKRGSNSLVLLGLIGTIAGFILALSGVDPSIAGDSSKVPTVVASLLNGMYIAFYTTLVGTVLHFCLNLYNRVLDQASAKIVNRIISMYVD